MNKKINNLKESFTKEKSIRENLEQALSESRKKYEFIKLELEEKEKTCVKLHRDNDDLQQKLFKERSKLEVPYFSQ